MNKKSAVETADTKGDESVILFHFEISHPVDIR